MTRALGLFILVLCLNSSLRAQIDNIPTDSISNYLTKKWVEQARFLGGRQVASYGDLVRYTFKSDSSFTKTIGKDKQRGIWKYDEEKRIVRLQIKGSTDFYLVQLSKTQLLLSSDLEEGERKGLGVLALFKRDD